MKFIYVFRTSVNRPMEMRKLSPHLNRLINRTGRWNFDLEDRDNILRVETRDLRPACIASALHMHGFECEELAG